MSILKIQKRWLHIVFSLTIFISINLHASDLQEYAYFLKKQLLAKPISTLKSLDSFRLTNYYKLADQKVIADNRARHLQTSLNLFRKQKYSLLLKSMISFEESYGKNQTMGWHDYFKINILETKIKDKSKLANQILKITDSFFKKDSKSKINDYNLRFAMYRMSLKYNRIKNDHKNLNREILNYKKLATKLNSQVELNWINRVIVELGIESKLTTRQVQQTSKAEQKGKVLISRELLSGFSYVHRADYELYQILENDFIKGDLDIYSKYLNQNWDEFTPSLIANLVLASIITQDLDKTRLYYLRFLESTALATFLENNRKAYQVLLNQLHGFKNEIERASGKESLNIDLGIVKKLQLCGQNTQFSPSEREKFNQELEVILYRKRINHINKLGSDESFLAYIQNLPLYKFNENRRQKLLSYFEARLFTIYKAQNDTEKILKHWNRLSAKTNLVSLLSNENQVILGRKLAQDIQHNKGRYYSYINQIGPSQIKQIEIFRHFQSKNWDKVVSLLQYKKTSDYNIENLIMKSISLAKLSLYKASWVASKEVLLSKQNIPEHWKQDFYLNYILVMKSTMSKVDFFKKLTEINLSIFNGSVEMPRVKEYAEFELIGLNMTLKQSSFEENLKNVNIFLKSYPRSKFYSTLIVTRAKILAQLKRIKESMEALQEVITKTTDKKLKLEALNELSILKIR